MSVSAIETELVDASGFEPTKNYQRQDYLAALARAINEIDETSFDGLTVEAQDWFNNAVKALNKKKELPDFPDVEEAEAEEDGETEEGDPPDDNPIDDSEPDDEAEAEEESEEEAEAEAPPVKKGKSNAKADPIKEFEPPVRKKVIPVRKQARHGGAPDRYGLNDKAKGHAAILMLEKGCKMTEVQDKIGGTYYNLLRKLDKEGHLVEKSPNGILTLTHKDDVAGATKKKAKK